MSGRGNLRQFFTNDGVLVIVPPSFRHRTIIVPPSLTPSLTPSLPFYNALQAAFFDGVAMSVWVD